MSKKISYFFLNILLLTSCKFIDKKNILNEKKINCNELEFKPHYHEVLVSGKGTSFIHYVYVKNFDFSCFDTLSFASIAKTYVDTATLFVPIESIAFISSVENFNPNLGEYDWVKIEPNVIINFRMNSQKNISSTYFYKNGIKTETEFNYLIHTKSILFKKQSTLPRSQ